MLRLLNIKRRARWGYLWVTSLTFFGVLACEWKPPRRPKIDKQKTSADQLKGVGVVLTDDFIFDEDDLLVTPKLKTSQSTTDQTERALESPDESKQPSQTERQPERQASAETSLSPVEAIKSRDYRLTIDPNGPPLIHLKRLVIAKSVRRRRPRGVSRIFKDTTKQVVLFLKVRNFEAPQKIQLKWIYQGQVIQRDRLKIGISPRWRTWSLLQLGALDQKLGEWRVEVETVKGQKLLGATHFKVETSTSNSTKR